MMSSAAIAHREESGIAVTGDQIDLIKKTVANGATDQELQLFLYDCQRRNVHPLDKLIHFTKRGGKYTPITSIDFMRSRAADTGDYAGNDDAAFIGNPKADDFAASVTVYRIVKGIRCAFSATARWSEYYSDSSPMWKKMPHTMLAKCAESLALRKGFPQQLAGLYSGEEMDQAGPTDAEFVEPVRAPKQIAATVQPVAGEWACGPALKGTILDLETECQDGGIYKSVRDRLEVEFGTRNPATLSAADAERYKTYLTARLEKAKADAKY
jgi:phage recombination protein Bet